MKKKILIVFFLLITVFVNAQALINMGGKQSYKIDALKKEEEFVYKTKGTREGFVLSLYGKTKDGTERELGTIQSFSGYSCLCNNGLLYFSVDNYFLEETNPGIVDELFVLNPKKGIIEKVLDAQVFTVSDDGRYICYCEVYQKAIEENHVVDYWYIYDTKNKISKVIINQKQKNNWDVGIPVFDKKTESFVFEIGYDDVVMDTISFNPYNMDFVSD